MNDFGKMFSQQIFLSVTQDKGNGFVQKFNIPVLVSSINHITGIVQNVTVFFFEGLTISNVGDNFDVIAGFTFLVANGGVVHQQPNRRTCFGVL